MNKNSCKRIGNAHLASRCLSPFRISILATMLRALASLKLLNVRWVWRGQRIWGGAWDPPQKLPQKFRTKYQALLLALDLGSAAPDLSSRNLCAVGTPVHCLPGVLLWPCRQNSRRKAKQGFLLKQRKRPCSWSSSAEGFLYKGLSRKCAGTDLRQQLLAWPVLHSSSLTHFLKIHSRKRPYPSYGTCARFIQAGPELHHDTASLILSPLGSAPSRSPCRT